MDSRTRSIFFRYHLASRANLWQRDPGPLVAVSIVHHGSSASGTSILSLLPCGVCHAFQGEGRIDAPNGEQRGAGRKRSEESNAAPRKRMRKKSGTSRREEGRARGENLSSGSSSLIGTISVPLEPEVETRNVKSPSESERDDTRSKGDDNAVLQALYDGAPLSSVFHHELAEGVFARRLQHLPMQDLCYQGLVFLVRPAQHMHLYVWYL